MIPYSASALCLFLSVIFDLLQLFFLAHTTLWGRGDGIQLSQNNASSYQDREMFAPFAQALAVEYLVKFTATCSCTYIPVHSIMIYCPP